MDLAKSYEFFQPEMVDSRIHIIGCGSVGSTVAELLARFGVTNIALYDFDTVEPHNIVNQMFTASHIGTPKTEALLGMLKDINPEIEVKLYTDGYTGQKLSGYIFLCVDSIDLRREIAESNRDNPYIKAMFDFRTRLTDAQHYAADWSNDRQKDAFIGSMQFSHEEAKEATPVSACNIALSVAPTVRMVSCVGVTNFVNFCRGQELKKMILIDAFSFQINAI